MGRPEDWKTAEPTRSVKLEGRSAKLLWAAVGEANPLVWLFPAARRG